MAALVDGHVPEAFLKLVVGLLLANLLQALPRHHVVRGRVRWKLGKFELVIYSKEYSQILYLTIIHNLFLLRVHLSKM